MPYILGIRTPEIWMINIMIYTCATFPSLSMLPHWLFKLRYLTNIGKKLPGDFWLLKMPNVTHLQMIRCDRLRTYCYPGVPVFHRRKVTFCMCCRVHATLNALTYSLVLSVYQMPKVHHVTWIIAWQVHLVRFKQKMTVSLCTIRPHSMQYERDYVLRCQTYEEIGID